MTKRSETLDSSNISNSNQSMAPVAQVWLIVFLLVSFQYAMQTLVYFNYLGEAFRTRGFLVTGILALALSVYFGGKAALTDLIRPYFRLPKNPFWIAFAVLWNFPLIILTVPLNDLLMGTPIVISRPYWIGFDAILKNIFLFTIVALCDELFWIGFVLPRLLSAGYSHLKASLAIGAFWGVSYIPLIFTRFFVVEGLTIESLVLSWFAMGPIYVWLYCRTSSAALVVLMTVTMQFSNWTLPILPDAPDFDNGNMSVLNLLTLLAGYILWKYFPVRQGVSIFSENTKISFRATPPKNI